MLLILDRPDLKQTYEHLANKIADKILHTIKDLYRAIWHMAYWYQLAIVFDQWNKHFFP